MQDFFHQQWELTSATNSWLTLFVHMFWIIFFVEQKPQLMVNCWFGAQGFGRWWEWRICVFKTWVGGSTTNYQLIVNCWFGAQWFGLRLDPLKWKGLLRKRGILSRIPNHQDPNLQLTTSWQRWETEVFLAAHSSRAIGAHPYEGFGSPYNPVYVQLSLCVCVWGKKKSNKFGREKRKKAPCRVNDSRDSGVLVLQTWRYPKLCFIKVLNDLWFVD